MTETRNYEDETQRYSTFGDKLLKHADVLTDIQQNGNWRPVTVQLSPTAACSSHCDFCSVDERDMWQRLSWEQIERVLNDFKDLGAKALELSVKGDEIIPYYTTDGFLKIKTIKEIVENKEGVESLTIKNKSMVLDEITDWIKHKQTEPLYKITLVSGKHITVTKSHSVYFYEDGQIIKKPVSDAKIGDSVVINNKYVQLNKYKDYLGKKIDADLCRLIGYFLAEGSFSFQRKGVPHGICFTFGPIGNEKENRFINDVEEILIKLGYSPKIYILENKTQVCVFSKELCQWFLDLDMGYMSNERKVPDIMFNVGKKYKIEFLQGLFAGDGNFRDSKVFKRGKHVGFRNQLILKTSSVHLQRTVSLLLDTIEISHTVAEGINKSRFIDGRELPETNYYIVSVSRRGDLEKIEKIITHMGKCLKYKGGKFSNHKAHLKLVKISKDCHALSIQKIEEVGPEDYVYDISVGDTHRFISSFGILCSNTGGGEPLLHKDIKRTIDLAHDLGYKIGIISNSERPGRFIDKEQGDKLTWYRASLTKLEEGKTVDDFDFSVIPEGRLGFSHILNVKTTPKTIDDMAELVERNPYVKFVRIAGNCLDGDSLETFKERYGETIDRANSSGKFFIKELAGRHTAYSEFCGVGPIRPYVYEDGNIYICTSHVLINRRVHPDWKVGHVDDIKGMYKKMNESFKKTGKPYEIDIDKCGECFYGNNNKILHEIVKGRPEQRLEDDDFT